MKHTPGPWKWEMKDDCTLLVSSVKSDIGYTIIMGEFFGTGHKETFMPDGANADLIAIAPEMFNLLYSLRDFVSEENAKIIEETLRKAGWEGESSD